MESRIRGVQEEAGLAETGRVLSVGYAMRKMMCATHGGILMGSTVTVSRVSMA